MRQIIVTVKNRNSLLDNTQPVTIRTSTGVGGTSRLDSLVDVVATEEEEGATPVYDPNTGKYIVRKLTPDDLDGSIDGGEF